MRFSVYISYLIEHVRACVRVERVHKVSPLGGRTGQAIGAPNQQPSRAHIEPVFRRRVHVRPEVLVGARRTEEVVVLVAVVEAREKWCGLGVGLDGWSRSRVVSRAVWRKCDLLVNNRQLNHGKGRRF